LARAESRTDRAKRRLTKGRLVGLDRSGPEPAATRAGAPLRPFTLPNLIGYLRLAAIPVFLYLAFDSGDGRTVASAILYGAIAGGDYVDGLVARATGQYSRLGAILDPIVDRLTILSGVVVCWHFELLPRWALALLIARELVTVALAEIGLRRGIDVEINWIGRIGVFLAMGGIFFALAVETWVSEALLLVGLAALLAATILYVRAATRRTQGPDQPSTSS
jgi:CDP-diacylglycerol--glycerol-3-phosphate 3-phosphatidyltransferase